MSKFKTPQKCPECGTMFTQGIGKCCSRACHNRQISENGYKLYRISEERFHGHYKKDAGEVAKVIQAFLETDQMVLLDY